MLNKTKITRLKPREKLYRELDKDGLYIEVKPNGGKYWRLRTKKADGKYSLYSLGKFPEVSIEEARVKRDEMRSLVSTSLDMSFEQACRAMFKEKPLKNESDRVDQLTRCERYLFPKLGNLPVDHVTPSHILPILEALVESGHHPLAKKLKGHINQTYQYAITRHKANTNPAQMFPLPKRKDAVRNHPAVLTERQFKQLLNNVVTNKSRFVWSTYYGLMVAAYIPFRSQEIRFAKPEHILIDEMLWFIPAKNNKVGRDFYQPITPSIMKMLKVALMLTDGRYLFSGRAGDGHMSENTLNKALKYLGYDGKHSLHGFRSTFSTLATDILDQDDMIIELSLGHEVDGEVKKAYKRSSRLARRKKLMKHWSDYVDSLLDLDP